MSNIETDNQAYFMADKIKAGDAGAFRSLFRLLYPSLLTFTEGFVKDRDVAEDLVQNVFMKIWVYRSSLDVTRPLRGYLYLLCRREVCNWFRREVTLQRFVNGLSREDVEKLATPDMADTAELDELSQMAERLIAQMPPKRREVFVLSRREGLSIDEIAVRLNISPRTVNKHMQLALRSMRAMISKENL